MADPITLAAIGAAAGAATNKKDPVKGALIGATLGFGGGAVAPSLLGSAAPAAGLTGITPMGAQAATGLAGGAAVAGPGTGALLGSQAAATGAGGSLLTKAMAPSALMAGSQLVSAMQPKSAPAMSMPVRSGQQVPITMDQIRAVDQGAFDVPPIDQRMAMFYPNARFDEQGNLTGMNTGTFTPLRPVVSRRLSLL